MTNKLWSFSNVVRSVTFCFRKAHSWPSECFLSFQVPSMQASLTGWQPFPCIKYQVDYNCFVEDTPILGLLPCHFALQISLNMHAYPVCSPCSFHHSTPCAKPTYRCAAVFLPCKMTCWKKIDGIMWPSTASNHPKSMLQRRLGTSLLVLVLLVASLWAYMRQVVICNISNLIKKIYGRECTLSWYSIEESANMKWEKGMSTS